MTEKVKITQEQADAIEHLIDDGYQTHQIIKNALNENWCNEPEEHHFNIESLNGMDPETLVFAVHGMYVCVIEPEIIYSLAEWVIYGDKIYRIYQIPSIGKVHIRNIKGGTFANVPIQELRHATPEEIAEEKERRKWAVIEPGDVLRIKDEPQAIGMFKGEGAEGTVLVETLFGAVIWSKSEIELYAKKVGASKCNNA